MPTPWKPSVGAAPSSGVSVGARPQLVDSLRIALIGCLVAGVVLALFEVALLLDVDDVLWLVLAFPMIACGYFAAGVRAWWLRPGSMMGPLIMLGGFTLVMAGLGNTGTGTLALAGALSATWILAVVVHLVLAFPSGRLRFRTLRVVVAAAYVNSVVLQVPQVLLGDGPAQAAAWAQHGLGTVVMASTAVALAVKLGAASPAQRRTLVPLYGYGMGVAGLIPLSSIVFRGLLDVSPVHVATVQLVAIAGVPVAFVLAALRGSFARTAEAEALATWLGSGPVRPPLAEALARALGDPSVVLAYWLPERSEFVDVSGQVVEVPSPGSRPRDAVPVEVGGVLVGAVVYDAATIDNRAVREAARVVALAIEGERLTAALRASEAQVRRSRARVVHAADRERARIAGDLHDGLQVRLVLLGVEAQRLANAARPDADLDALRTAATRLREGLDVAAEEVRRLAHHVMPSSLADRGLALALEDLTDRMPLPTRFEVDAVPAGLAPEVARTAYFVVAEGLANAVKHGRATSASVLVARERDRLVVEVTDDGVGGASPQAGGGIGGLQDRVEALGGRLRIDSPRGGGTTLRVEVPCES